MKTLALLALGLFTACSSGTSSSGDLSPPRDASAGGTDLSTTVAFSCCGRPGDKGNSVGVGQFCDDNNPCTGSKAIFCASLGGDDKQHFCTFLCKSDGGADQCAEGASCVCQGQCGCVPTMCVTAPPDGC